MKRRLVPMPEPDQVNRAAVVAVYNSYGPDGFWEHGHPPCKECLDYHEHIAAIVGERRELLAACEAAERIRDLWLPVGDVAVEHEHEARALHGLRNKILAAIAKATGETP